MHVLYKLSKEDYLARKPSDKKFKPKLLNETNTGITHTRNKSDKKTPFNERVILQLNNLSKEINALYGYAEVEGKREPAINVGPCGPVANSFFHLWNKYFSEKVSIVFIFKINSDECWHIAIRLPNRSAI